MSGPGPGTPPSSQPADNGPGAPATPPNIPNAIITAGAGAKQDVHDFRLSKGTFAAAYSAYDDLLHVICVKEDRSMIWISYSNPKTSLDNFKTGTLPGKAADGTRIAVVAKSAERGKPETYAESCLFYQDAATPDHLNTMSYEISKADWTAMNSRWMPDILHGSYLVPWWPADGKGPMLFYQEQKGAIYMYVSKSGASHMMHNLLKPDNDIGSAFAAQPQNTAKLPAPFDVYPDNPTDAGSNDAMLVYTTPVQQGSGATVEYTMKFKLIGADPDIALSRGAARPIPHLRDITVTSVAAAGLSNRAFLYSSAADDQWRSAIWDGQRATCPMQSATTVVQPQLIPGMQIIQLGKMPQDVLWMMYVDSPGFELKIRKDADGYATETILPEAKGCFTPLPPPPPAPPTPPPVQPVNPPDKPSDSGHDSGTGNDQPATAPNDNPVNTSTDKPDVPSGSSAGGSTGHDQPSSKPDDYPVVNPDDQPVTSPPSTDPAKGSDADGKLGSPATILRPPRQPLDAASEGTPFCKEVIMPQSDKTAMHAASLDSNHRAMAVMAPKEKLWELGKSPTITYAFLPGEFVGTAVQHQKVADTVKIWSKYANLTFQEVPDNSDVRITFDARDGSWSLVGSDCAKARVDEATMNLGWIESTNRTSDKEKATILHEFGHVLGMLHEHQSPAHGRRSVIDPNKAVKFYMASQGWTEEMVWEQIINTLTERDVSNFSEVDTHSIMHYAMPKQVTGREAIEYNYKLSDLDKAFAVINYPRSLAAEAAMTDEKAWTLEHALEVVGIAKQDAKMTRRILDKRAEITDDNTSPLSELRDLFTEWTHAAQRARMQAEGDGSAMPRNRGDVGKGNQQGINNATPAKDDIPPDPSRAGAQVSCDLVIADFSVLACGYDGGEIGSSAANGSQGRSHALNDPDLLSARGCLALTNRSTSQAKSDRTEITWTINWRSTDLDPKFVDSQAEIREEDQGHSKALIEEALAKWESAADIAFAYKPFGPEQAASLDDFLSGVDLVICFQDAHPLILADCVRDVSPEKRWNMWRSHYAPLRRVNSVEAFTAEREALVDGQPDLEKLKKLLQPATTYDIVLRGLRDEDSDLRTTEDGIGQTWSGRTAAIRTICHEAGHFLGLDHEYCSVYSKIMRDNTDGGMARGHTDMKTAVDAVLAERLKATIQIAGKLDRGSVMDVKLVHRENDQDTWYASQSRSHDGFYTVALPSDIDCANLAMLYPGHKMTNAAGKLLTNKGKPCKDFSVNGDSRLAGIWRTLVLPTIAYESMADLARVGAWDQMRASYLALLSEADARFIEQLKNFQTFGLGDIDPEQLYDYHIRGPAPPQPYAYLPGMLPTQYDKPDEPACSSPVMFGGDRIDIKASPLKSGTKTIVTFRIAEAVEGETMQPSLLPEFAKLIADGWRAPFFALEYVPDQTREVDIIIALQSAKKLPIIRTRGRIPVELTMAELPVSYALSNRTEGLTDTKEARKIIRQSISNASLIDSELLQRAARPTVEHDICFRVSGRPSDAVVMRHINGAIGHLLGLVHQPAGLVSTLCDIGWACAHKKGGHGYKPSVLGAVYKALKHLFKTGAVTSKSSAVGRFSQGSLMDHGQDVVFVGAAHLANLGLKSAATPTRYDLASLALIYPGRWLARDRCLCKFNADGVSVTLTPNEDDPDTIVRLLCGLLELDSGQTGRLVALAIDHKWEEFRELAMRALADANEFQQQRVKIAIKEWEKDYSEFDMNSDAPAWLELMQGSKNDIDRGYGIDDAVDTSDEEDTKSDATTDELELDTGSDEEQAVPPSILARHVLPDPDPCRTCKEGSQSQCAARLVRDGQSTPTSLSYHVVGHTGTRSRHASAAETALVKQALALWRPAVSVDFVQGDKDADMIIFFAKNQASAGDSDSYTANGSYCSPDRIRPGASRKSGDPDIEHDICLRGALKDLPRTAVHMIGHFLGLAGAHVGLVNNYLSSDCSIKLDSDAEQNFLALVKEERLEVQYAVDLGSVMDDMEGLQPDLALRAMYTPSEFDLAQVALSHPGPHLYTRKPTALFKRAMQVLDVPEQVQSSVESALQRRRWSLARALWHDHAVALLKALDVRCGKLERRLIRRLPKKPAPVTRPPPPTRPLPVDPTLPVKTPANPPAKPSKQHNMDPLRMRDLSSDEAAALAKTKAAMSRTFPNFKITLWEKLNSFFGPSGQSDSFLSVQSPTRYLDKEEFAYDLEGIYSNFVKPVAVNEAEFRLTDQLFSPSRVVSAPNGRSLSMVYEQAIMNLIPKYGEDGDKEIRTAREGLAGWLLEETTDRESLYVNNGDLLDRPDSIIPTEDAARAARGQVTATPRKASRMEAAEHFMNTYYNEEIRWKTDKTDIITRAMNSAESVRVRQLEAATRLIANTSAARQAKLSFLYNDAVVRGHLHDVRECVAQLDIKTTAEFLQDAKDALRESAVASLYGASRVLPVIMQPLDWSQGLDTKFAPEDLSSDPDMIEIAIEAKTKQIDSFRRQLGLLQAHVSEDPQTLKERFNNAADTLSKAEANLSGSYTENTAFAAGKIIDVVLAATAPEVLGAEGAAAEGVEAELYDSQAIMSKLNGATGETAQETSKLQDIIKALDPKATLEGLVKGITDVNVAQAAVMKAAAEYSSRQTDWAKSMSATTAEQLAAVLRQIATATTELSDLRLKWKMAKVSQRKRDALVNKATNDVNAAKNNKTLLEAGAGKLKLPTLDDLKYQDEVNATKGGGSRWLSINLSSKTAASSSFSGDTSSSSHTGWNVNFFLAGGGKETDTAGSEHREAGNSSEVSIEISMNCTLVTVDRSSWFQPQFFGMSESFMRNSEHVRWSGNWPEEYRVKIKDPQPQPQPTLFGLPPATPAEPPKGPFDPSLAVSEGVLKDKYIESGLLTCYPTGYIICKDVLIKISNLDLSNASSQKFMHEQVSSSGGFLFFRHTTTSETNTTTQSSNFQMASDGMIVRIPGPQIIGYIQQMVPYDQTTKYDPKYALKKAFHLPRIMPQGDDTPTPQHGIKDRQRAIDTEPAGPAKTTSKSNGTGGEYRDHHERASGHRGTTRTTTKTKIAKPANGYGDTETEQDTDVGYDNREDSRHDPSLDALDQMPDSAKEALYAYLGKTLGKKGASKR